MYLDILGGRVGVGVCVGGADGWWKRLGGGAVMGASSVSKGNHKGAGWDNELVVGCAHEEKKDSRQTRAKISRETNLSGRLARIYLFLCKVCSYSFKKKEI